MEGRAEKDEMEELSSDQIEADTTAMEVEMDRKGKLKLKEGFVASIVEPMLAVSNPALACQTSLK